MPQFPHMGGPSRSTRLLWADGEVEVEAVNSVSSRVSLLVFSSPVSLARLSSVSLDFLMAFAQTLPLVR